MKQLSMFVLCLSASGLSLPAQEITTYFAAGLDQAGGKGAFIAGAGRIVTKVTLPIPGPAWWSGAHSRRLRESSCPPGKTEANIVPLDLTLRS